MTSKNSNDETEHYYRVCRWCGNDSVDDPRITWAIKSKTKRIGLCADCEREVPVEWIEIVDEENDCSKTKKDK
jgi:hypothetical protein